MKKGEQKQIVLAVAAHPDDIDFSSGGTIAKWIQEGADVYYFILTDGSRGSDDPKMTHAKLAKIRKYEQLKAAEMLGVKNVFFGNYKDTQLEVNLKLKKAITKKIREIRPTKVLTFNPQTLYSTERNFINHSDHRAAGLATLDCVYPYARDRLTFPDHEKAGLAPHKVKELYMVSFDDGNYISDITKTLDKKMAAAKTHTSQISGDIINRIAQWNKANGKNHGCKYAEVFVKLELA